MKYVQSVWTSPDRPKPCQLYINGDPFDWSHGFDSARECFRASDARDRQGHYRVAADAG